MPSRSMIMRNCVVNIVRKMLEEEEEEIRFTMDRQRLEVVERRDQGHRGLIRDRNTKGIFHRLRVVVCYKRGSSLADIHRSYLTARLQLRGHSTGVSCVSAPRGSHTVYSPYWSIHLPMSGFGCYYGRDSGITATYSILALYSLSSHSCIPLLCVF